MYLEKMKLVQTVEEDELYLTQMDNLICSESESAQRVREYRERQKGISQSSKIEAKSNAVRQKQFRAKKSCSEKQHIPLIEDHQNNKRYSGNYYVVIKRDKFKCAICGSIENLCVHHIDGFDENKPENNAVNKMITLCRGCHSNVHAGQEIDKDILDSIDYFENSNEMLPGNADVTPSNVIETNCNTYTDTDTNTNTHKKEKTKKTFPPTVEMVREYCESRGNGIDPQEFVDYYEAANWYRGKTKITNWKKCVNTWERKRGFVYQGDKKQTNQQMLQPEGQLQRILQ